MMIGNFDLLIGATAVHHNLTLLTNNRSHFGVPGVINGKFTLKP